MAAKALLDEIRGPAGAVNTIAVSGQHKGVLGEAYLGWRLRRPSSRAGSGSGRA